MKPSLSEAVRKEVLRDLILDLPEGDMLTLRVTGHSMYPLLQEGDRITVRRVRAHELKLGDLVVFYRSGQEGRGCIVHRLLWRGARKGQKRYYARGDHESSAEFFLPSNIVGRVESATRGKSDVVFPRHPMFLALKGALSYGLRRVLSK